MTITTFNKTDDIHRRIVINGNDTTSRGSGRSALTVADESDRKNDIVPGMLIDVVAGKTSPQGEVVIADSGSNTRRVAVERDYKGMTIDDEYVVGVKDGNEAVYPLIEYEYFGPGGEYNGLYKGSGVAETLPINTPLYQGADGYLTKDATGGRTQIGIYKGLKDLVISDGNKAGIARIIVRVV